MQRRLAFLTGVGMGTVLFVSACAKRPPETPAARGLERTNTHWIQDDNLRALMITISENDRRLSSAAARDVEDAKAVLEESCRQASAIAVVLSESAMRLPAAVAGMKISDEQRKEFETEAATLQRQAADLKAAADARQVEKMQAVMKGITGTCTACHIRHRDLSGDLWLRKASADDLAPSRFAGR